MAMTEFKAPTAEAANLLKLVATYCGVASNVAITVTPDVKDVEFVADGAPAFGLNTACRSMAGQSPASTQLLGQGAEQQAKVGFLISPPAAGDQEASRRDQELAVSATRPCSMTWLLQVAEWLAFRHTELTPLMDDKLAKMNEWLQSRTYLTGSSLTLADLVLYATVQPAVVSKPAHCRLPSVLQTRAGHQRGRRC